MSLEPDYVDPISGETFAAGPAVWHSPKGRPPALAFGAKSIRPEPGAPGIWRYVHSLPEAIGESPLSLGEGQTRAVSLVIDGHKGRFKLELLNPTGSYKDRGSAALIAKARDWGVDRAVIDSSGNAGASVAAYCAAAGIRCDVFVPASASPAKLRQIEAYGAVLHAVEGERGAALDAALEAARSSFYASHVWNPYFIQGMKTLAFELAEREMPEAVVVPAGNGALLLGLALGFRELLACNRGERLPRLYAVQSARYAAVVRGLHPEFVIEEGKTVAEGIAVQWPPRLEEMVTALRESGGDAIAVSEDEILEAHGKMAHVGMYIEKTSAACVAGWLRLRREGVVDERAVCVLTGTGLKSG